ncbi:MAG: hypothetical protein ACQEWE_13205 [Bacillota bacterium]
MDQLIKETQDSLEQYTPRLLSAIKDLVIFFREENTIKAFEIFNPIIEGVEWVVKAVVLMNNNEKYIDDLNTLNNFLESINEAINHEEYVMVADIFEYEILGYLDKLINEMDR